MACVLILGILGLLLSQTADILLAKGTEKKSNDKEIVPLITLSGWKTKITKALYCRFESEKAWNALYLEHQFGKSDPEEDVDWRRSRLEVDFGHCMVLAFFHASKEEDFVLHSISEKDGHFLVRVTPLYYQTGIVSFPPPAEDRTESDATQKEKEKKPSEKGQKQGYPLWAQWTAR